MVEEPRLTALIVCGGGPVEGALWRADLVVAADGGLRQAVRLGLTPDLLVGDLDSATAAEVEAFELAGGKVERHPRDKDSTDLELALQACLDRGATHVVVAGGMQGRLDHTLGNALVLASNRWNGLQIDARFGPAQAHVIRGERSLTGTPGETLSLFALGGVAEGIRTKGLRWELDGGSLEPGMGLGISNGFAVPDVSIGLGSGVLLAVRPGREEG